VIASAAIAAHCQVDSVHASDPLPHGRPGVEVTFGICGTLCQARVILSRREARRLHEQLDLELDGPPPALATTTDEAALCAEWDEVNE